MPGVTITTATRSGPVNLPVPDSGRYYIAGQFERGPVSSAQLVRSVAELALVFGDPTGYSAAYDDLRTYFEEGGAEAYVVRVVGPAATKGTVTAVDTAGTPVATVRFDAANAGAWSGDLDVVVTAGKVANSFDVEVRYRNAVVETFPNILTPAGAVAALAASRYVRAVDLGSATAAPANNPAVGTYSVTAGGDDRASITATTMATALAALVPELGSGAVAIPGYPADLVGAALIAHAKSHRRIALLAPAVGQSKTQVIGLADTLIGDDGRYAGLFYPWVSIPSSASTTKLISPEGYVAAARARGHRDTGPWRAPAGAIAEAVYVVGTERDIARAEGDELDEAHVSAIRTIAGTTRLYGWRSLSDDEANYSLLNGQDVVNAFVVQAETDTEDLVFQPIDSKGHLLGKLQARLEGIAARMRQAEGLYPRTAADGTELDPGYSVDVGPSVNTAALTASNKVAAVVAIRVSPVGTLVDITIVKAGMTASV